MIRQTFGLRKLLICTLVSIFIFTQESILFSAMSKEGSVEIITSEEDTRFLREVMKETFDSIMYFRNPVTGIYSSSPNDDTSQSKCDSIALSLGAIALGGHIGLISDEEAKREIAKTLEWIEKIPTAGGFPAEPVNTRDTTKASTGWVAVADMGWYPCCLILVAEAYPEFRPRIMKLIDAMEWEKFYDEKEGLLKGVYAVDNGVLKSGGHELIIASEQRLSIFIAIASGKVPADIWDRMPRNYVTRYGVEYFKPGEALGFGEQPWGMSHFVDERKTDVGMSNANLAWAQMHYAIDMQYPVWGWSNGMNLDRYMGFGDKDTSWSVVNPHAVSPALIYYPLLATKALRKMEELGLREPIRPDGETKHSFGLRACYDVDHKKSSEIVLAGLDQEIILFSLVNYLHDGAVWKLFKHNKLAQKGFRLIKEYNTPKTGYIEIYKKRDEEGPSVKYKTNFLKGKTILADNFSAKGTVNNLNGTRKAYLAKQVYSKGLLSLEFAGSDKNPGKFTEVLNGADLTHYRAIRLKLKGQKSGKVNVILRAADTGGYLPIKVTTEMQEIIVPLRSLYGGRYGYDYALKNPKLDWTGMWYDRSNAKEIIIEQIDVPKIEIAEMSFISLTEDEINEAASALVIEKPTFFAEDGTFDSMESNAEWFTADSGHNSKISLSSVKGHKDMGVLCAYSFSEDESWALMGRKVKIDLSDKESVSFMMKVEGGPCDIEVKFVDSTGATYMKVLEGMAAVPVWKEVMVPIGDFQYAWGGVKADKVKDAKEFHFAVTSKTKVQGKVVFDELKLK